MIQIGATALIPRRGFGRHEALFPGTAIEPIAPDGRPLHHFEAEMDAIALCLETMPCRFALRPLIPISPQAALLPRRVGRGTFLE
jgi:hypothetical protein